MENKTDFIQRQNEIRQDYKIGNKVPYPIVILRKRSTKGILFLLAFSIAVPVLIYYFLIDKAVDTSSDPHTCSVDSTYRIQCGAPNASLNYCYSINCCFDNSTKLCFHYMPSKYYYFLDGSSYTRSLEKTPFNKEMLPNVSFTVNEIDENNIEIILHDTNINMESGNVSNKNYFYNINQTNFYVEVFRNDSNNNLLLTTAKGPTIVSERYWEWSFQLTDEYLFGLGQTLIQVDKNSTLTKVIYANSKDHNTLPVFMAYSNGSYHGLIVRHSGPLEVTVLPSKLVSLKSLAGEKILLELSIGPTIQDVIKQQRRNHAISVDLETLGVHLCREGSSITLQSILSDYQKEIGASNDIQFRYESDCIHENIVTALMNDNKDTNIASIRDAINTIRNEGHRFILSLTPQVLDGSAFYENLNLSVFYQTIKNNKTEDYKGKFLGSTVTYPYFGHPSIDQYLQIYVDELNRIFGEFMATDFILGYNWPADDSFKMEASDDDFQYLSDTLKEAMSSTLPWNVTSNSEYHFVHHTDYAATQIEKLKAILGTESTFVTASHNFDVTEPLMLQNIDITWTNFQKAITTILSNSIFGYPLTSIPVCGSTINFNSSHEFLCMRWYLMSSTAPIFRISSDEPRRDPNSLAALTTKTTGNEAKDAIDFRYSLRYYFYTVLNNNEPLMRPMFYDFPDDNETFPLVHQYMVGGSLLVAQPTLPDQTQVEVYLPESVDTWYEFWGGQAYSYATRKTSLVTLFIVETDWVAFIPEGVIIPFTSTSDENTEVIRLIIALNVHENTSTGSFKFGVDSTFSFTSTDQQLTVTKEVGDATEETITFVLDEITVYSTSSVTTCRGVNQPLIDINWTYTYNC